MDNHKFNTKVVVNNNERSCKNKFPKTSSECGTTRTTVVLYYNKNFMKADRYENYGILPASILGGWKLENPRE